jgi:hypothetical protein
MTTKSWLTGMGVAVLVCLAGCGGPRVDYIGEIYAPTPHVDVFYQKADTKRPYRVMGKATVTGWESTPAGDMQAKLIEEARMRGADAVLIERLDVVAVGESTHWNESASKSGDAESETKWKRGKEKTETETYEHKSKSGHGSTRVTREKVLRATFLKYQ